jgi:sugar (pentulose or hexulose) kinase
MDGRRGFHQRPGMMWFSRPPTLGQVERRDLAWAALWDHACAIASNIAQLERVSNVAPARVLGVGGGFRSRTFARLVADFTGRPIVISSDGADATVLGAARVVSSALGTPMAPYESSTTVIPDPPEVIAQYPGVDVWLAGSKWLTDAPIPVS